MNLIELLILLIVAGVCGSIGQALAGFSRGGCLTSIATGFIGALVGLWIARTIELPELLPVTIGEATFPILWSIIGSTALVGILGWWTRNRPTES
tara:strand:+ start:5392 stop:5676 length:285 start_codon:yes stop_codon:yes gene_type:complete